MVDARKHDISTGMQSEQTNTLLAGWEIRTLV
jgi:hypothetical protein